MCAKIAFLFIYLFLAAYQLSTDPEPAPDQLVAHRLHYITEIGRKRSTKRPKRRRASSIYTCIDWTLIQPEPDYSAGEMTRLPWPLNQT